MEEHILRQLSEYALKKEQLKSLAVTAAKSLPKTKKAADVINAAVDSIATEVSRTNPPLRSRVCRWVGSHYG